MATPTPLFTDAGALRQAVGLSDGDAERLSSAFDQAVRGARSAIFRELGQSLVANLRAIPTTHGNPETTSQIRRDVAETVEIDLVRLNLLDHFGAVIDDGSNGREEWNEAAPFRDLSQDERRDTRSRLQTEINRNLRWLEEGASEGRGSAAKVVVTGPTDGSAPRLLGDKLQGTW